MNSVAQKFAGIKRDLIRQIKNFKRLCGFNLIAFMHTLYPTIAGIYFTGTFLLKIIFILGKIALI